MDVVQRYGGNVDKFTGDGVMAVFGAPIALEDHAIRACIAAVDIQKRVRDLAAEVNSRDGIELALRVGLNSGEVIAGEVGSRSASYTTVGDQVGMAQRMESVAMPGGVVVSESTARLVEGQVVLGERRLVQIKGADAPVPAYALLSITGLVSRDDCAHHDLRGQGLGDVGPDGDARPIDQRSWLRGESRRAARNR